MLLAKTLLPRSNPPSSFLSGMILAALLTHYATSSIFKFHFDTYKSRPGKTQKTSGNLLGTNTVPPPIIRAHFIKSALNVLRKISAHCYVI